MRYFLIACTLAFVVKQVAMGASNLSDYAGTYQCPTILRTAPAEHFGTSSDVKVEVSLDGDKVTLHWSEPAFPNVALNSGVMANGIMPGDFQFDGNDPAVMVALTNSPGPVLSFSYNKPEDAAVANGCLKQ
jgi:hypothetical protein